MPGSIEVAWLDENKIETISRRVFSNLSNLKRISLQNVSRACFINTVRQVAKLSHHCGVQSISGQNRFSYSAQKKLIHLLHITFIQMNIQSANSCIDLLLLSLLSFSQKRVENPLFCCRDANLANDLDDFRLDQNGLSTSVETRLADLIARV